ncbi:hypothetical protein [Zunongwangia sp.]|uniref:hypothetical protein n=1 Tax=Zunongwangia sp. TaxID=1965325 RepID=UPI003AA7AD30
MKPLGDDGDPFKWIKFGEPEEYWAGFMWNNTSRNYGNGNDFTIYTYDNRDIVLAPNNGNIILNPRNTAGNIGIGITNPNYKLDVYGTIHAKEVRVDLNSWPDYVFEKDYKLPTIKEVKQFIKEEGHLQGVPSAKEVKEEGIMLGGMDAKLLQKIEELTLYLIKQNEEIAYLKEELKNLKLSIKN